MQTEGRKEGRHEAKSPFLHVVNATKTVHDRTFESHQNEH